MTEIAEPLVSATGLTKHFDVRRGVLRRKVGSIRAVDGVDLTIRRGSSLALVGESGSGKSTLGRLLLRLVEPTAGRVVLDGTDVTALSSRELRNERRRMQMVFQDPYASLDPRLTVGAAVRESLDIRRDRPRSERDARVRELFDLVNLDTSLMSRYPHELSGGQRQRVAIARALASDPAFIVADEAIASLDVSVQAQIIALLERLRRELDLTLLFISHDLAMARYLCDEIAVLYLGRIVEHGSTEVIIRDPKHPYTRALLSAVPELPGRRAVIPHRIVLAGEVPSASDPPSGCLFRTRCPYASERCAAEVPELRLVDGRLTRCHFAEDIARTELS